VKLSLEDVDLFYRLTYALHCYINRKLSILQGGETPEAVRQLTIEKKAQLRSALWNNVDLINSFVRENPFDLSGEELKIVNSWNHFVQGRFIMVGYQKRYAVFLNGEEQLAYGVLALSDDFETLLGSHLPIVLETVLLPFKGNIITDGMIAPYNVSFGKCETGSRLPFRRRSQNTGSSHPFRLPSSRRSKAMRIS